MAILLSLPPSPHHPLKPPENPTSTSNKPKPSTLTTTTTSNTIHKNNISKRQFILKTATSLCAISFATQNPPPQSLAEPSPPPKPAPLGISNTNSWFQYYGDGFSIRVPPQFEDVTEPEDENAGMSLYGDKAKEKPFAARFESTDGSEVLSVLIRPCNQLKITFLEFSTSVHIFDRSLFTLANYQAQEVTDLGSLRDAARIFVPGGATLYSARTLKIKEEEDFRTYYFYEFGRYDQHVALVAAVNSGKAIVAGATAPESKWDDDGVKLRSAAISLTLL
ncbi:hypothetical protein Tsubulata_000280 [Turnera subulata]|uniref:PsbP C-terminal domain-containing protein n=1 Tax=Turnera subulata TaxID=218843 RepID=A0A9Q0J064_9ROSI|nr:hypothetical protein Tsubulata_000280 [Turnera subulata]